MKLDCFEPYSILLPGDCHQYSGDAYDDRYDDYDDPPSYSKYGGYNGYDDNTIDSAFEGMPDATWNVD